MAYFRKFHALKGLKSCVSLEIYKRCKVGEFLFWRSNLLRFFHPKTGNHLCTMFIDLHTHHPTLSPGILEIESVYYGQSRQPKASTRSAGLHPWFLESDLEAGRRWLQDQAILPGTVAIGEAGLDKVCKTPWDLQMKAFQYCVEISEALEKPLIIHCVRAFSEMIALKVAWKPIQAWIFHGFNKNTSTANMLLQHGCFLSFGTSILLEQSHASASLKASPPDRFFLETDDAEVPIEAVYQRAAAIRGIGERDLADLVELNCRRILNPEMLL